MVRKRKPFIPLFYSAIVVFFILSILLLAVNPYKNIDVLKVSFSPLILFFILFLIFSFFLSSFLFLNKRRGLLVAVFFTGFLFLRFFGFTNLFHAIVLATILVLAEVFLNNKKTPQTRQNPKIQN